MNDQRAVTRSAALSCPRPVLVNRTTTTSARAVAKAANIHCAVLLSLGRAALDKFMERYR
jgi:hypothetical protein